MKDCQTSYTNRKFRSARVYNLRARKVKRSSLTDAGRVLLQVCVYYKWRNSHTSMITRKPMHNLHLSTYSNQSCWILTAPHSRVYTMHEGTYEPFHFNFPFNYPNRSYLTKTKLPLGNCPSIKTCKIKTFGIKRGKCGKPGRLTSHEHTTKCVQHQNQSNKPSVLNLWTIPAHQQYLVPTNHAHP